jgi:hypothetical protein
MRTGASPGELTKRHEQTSGAERDRYGEVRPRSGESASPNPTPKLNHYRNLEVGDVGVKAVGFCVPTACCVSFPTESLADCWDGREVQVGHRERRGAVPGLHGAPWGVRLQDLRGRHLP